MEVNHEQVTPNILHQLLGLEPKTSEADECRVACGH